MRAAVLWEPNGAFDVRGDVSRRPAGPGEVAVRVRAAGVCHTDLALAGGGFGQPFPVVLGHEGAGVVTEVGPGVDGLAVGDHVVIAWVAPCGRCWFCRHGDRHLCSARRSSAERSEPDLEVDGRPVMAGMGTAVFAEETVVPAGAAVPIADDVPLTLAALLGCAVSTGVGAVLRTARVEAGSTVLVVGCGGVGLSAVQAARLSGAALVAAVDPVASRRQAALDLGASVAVAPEAQAELLGRTAAGGFDYTIDAAGAPATIRAAFDLARRGGTVVVVGAGSREASVCFSPYELFHDEKKLTGSFYGSADLHRDVPVLVDLWRAGRLDLEAMVTTTAPLDAINDAAAALRAGEGIRTVLTP